MDYNEGKILINLANNQTDVWTVSDAIKGTSIMGATGSGKTSASGMMIAKSFLKEGWGGLVLCAKTDEAKLWKGYCEQTGRLSDLILFGKNSVNEKGEIRVFNPLDYEFNRSGEGAGETSNLTNLFMNIYRMGNRIASEGDTKEERFWDTALKRCLNRVFELLKLSGEDLSYANMVKILTTSNNIERGTITEALVKMELDGMAFLSNDSHYCLKCICAIQKSYDEGGEEVPLELRNAFELVLSYFGEIMPTMGSRTKSIVTESFMGLAEPFLSGLLGKHFAGKNNVLPESIYEEGKIIVLDFPVKEFLDAGIIAQSLFKLMFQQALERRNTEKHSTPVFLWCDEAQYFVNPYDQIFLTTARSSRAATVFLSQSISNYYAVMGSGADAKARVDSLMGNLCTKIFHANSDSETNEYASKLIGSDFKDMKTYNEQYTSVSLRNTYSEGSGTQIVQQVLPKTFTMLRTGGSNNNCKVDSIITVNGKRWANNRNFLDVEFDQNIKQPQT